MFALILAPFFFVACKGDGGSSGEDCVSDREFFLAEVQPMMQTTCFACHNASGQASSSKLILQPQEQTGFLDANIANIRDVASFEKDGISILLSKPSMQIPHEGGAIVQLDTDEYKVLEELIGRYDSPQNCGGDDNTGDEFDGVVLLTPEETLRKATLNIAGRLPTAAEEFRVATGGVDALDVELDRIMTEQAFYNRVERIFSDLFLTERYLGGNNAVDLLEEDFYPDARWFVEDEDRDFSGENQQFLQASRDYANNSVAQEPFKLAAYLVKNDRPFTEIVTADYMLVNPFTARVYGVTDVSFENPLDPNEWREGHIPGGVHAGVLTSPMWLNRFPTTDTNRNRHRARMVYWFFLAIDVMRLAERPIDPSSIVDFNPVMNADACVSCHNVIDPMAGLLQNWDETGAYNPREDGWYNDMFKPGYSSQLELDFNDRLSAAQFLGQNLAEDPLFAIAMVHHIYRAVTGQDPFQFPSDETDPDFEHDLAQYQIQETLFSKMADDFRDTNYNLKTIFKEVIKSPYFRAKNHVELDEEQSVSEINDLGMGRMLTPELLDAKIKAVTGMYWAEDNEDRDHLLLDENEYMILYGGIDSDEVIKRITTPNGIMAGIQMRMANEMACAVTARDFTSEPGHRRLFPHVEISHQPRDDNGFAIADAEAAIRKNIQHLHWHVLGERLDANDPEIDRTYNLFVQTWEEGNNKMGGEVNQGLDCRAEQGFNGEDLPEGRRVTEDPTYTVRAWMAVVTYLLSDYRFLFE